MRLGCQVTEPLGTTCLSFSHAGNACMHALPPCTTLHHVSHCTILRTATMAHTPLCTVLPSCCTLHHAPHCSLPHTATMHGTAPCPTLHHALHHAPHCPYAQHCTMSHAAPCPALPPCSALQHALHFDLSSSGKHFTDQAVS